MQRTRFFSFTLSALALALTTLTASTASAAVLKADFNNDGYEDLVVGSPFEDVGSILEAGAISVFYGTASGPPPSPNRQWYQDSAGIAGASEAGDLFGWAVAVGDFNRDGYDDVAIGVPSEDIAGIGPDGAGTDAGVVNIIYGSVSGLQAQGNQMLSLATLDPSFAESGANFGQTLTTGDFNGDGYEDLAVGAPRQDRIVGNAGGVVVFFGGASGFVNGRATLIAQGQPRVPSPAELNDYFGESLTAADFDRDGYTDLAIGMPHEDIGSIIDAGAVAILYGAPAPFGFSDTRSIALIDSGAGASVEANDWFGSALTTGDFNGDSYPDLAVSAPHEDDGATDAGAVTILYSSRSGLNPTTREYWPANRPGLPDKAETGDFFGWSLAAADFTGDGIADLAIGVPTEKQERTLRSDRDSTGQVTVLYGSRNGMTINARSYWHQDQPDVLDSREEGDRFGWALSVGDFNHDNRADLVVGVPGENIRSATNGMVQIFYGTSAGLSADPILGPQFFSEAWGNREAVDMFGWALP